MVKRNVAEPLGRYDAGLRQLLEETEKGQRAIKPFACPYLVMAPEPVLVSSWVSEGYKNDVVWSEGDLLCLAEHALTRCNLHIRYLVFDEEGHIEASCGRGKFTLALVEFEPIRNYDELKK